MNRSRIGAWFACAMVMAVLSCAAAGQPVFNVKHYGATGLKSDDARPALQKAIDACGKAGGGRVYVPPGEYTSGQLHLRSGVRLYVEAGATIYATLDSSQYDGAFTCEWGGLRNLLSPVESPESPARHPGG